jgi:Flp pilus assembly protein TadG
MLSRATPSRARRRGAAAVEFALLSPLLLGLLLGVWEVGRLVEAQQILSNAAREAGRQASAGTRNTSQVQQAATTYVQQAGLPTAGLNVDVANLTSGARSDPTTAQQLDRFRITVTLPFDNVRWVLLNKLTNVTTLTARAEWYSMNDVPVTISPNLPVD